MVHGVPSFTFLGILRVEPRLRSRAPVEPPSDPRALRELAGRLKMLRRGLEALQLNRIVGGSAASRAQVASGVLAITREATPGRPTR